jgi:hypothetical protein
LESIKEGAGLMVANLEFLDYGIFDDSGLIGIENDAPEEIKKAYADFMKAKEEAAKEGVKL